MKNKFSILLLVFLISLISFAVADLSVGNGFYYNFDDNYTTSNTLIDFYSRNNATCTMGGDCNTVLFGKVKNSTQFNGINDTVYNSWLYKNTTNYSIFSWVYTNNTGATTKIYESDGGFAQVIELFATTGVNTYPVCGMRTYAGGQQRTKSDGTVAYPANSWVHIGCMYNGSELSIWVNGSKKDSVLVNNSKSALNNLTIGSTTGRDLLFRGYLDEFRVWNRSLSTSEINEIYSSALSSTLNISSTFPINNSYMPNRTINFNLTVNSSTNFTANFYINGTINQSRNYSNGVNVFTSFNETFANGNYYYHFNISNVNDSEITTNNYFFVNSETPNLNLLNPLSTGNSSPFNLSLNVNISVNNLNYTNLTIFYDNGTTFWTYWQNGETKSYTYTQNINFTEGGNYSVFVKGVNKGGIQNNVTTWFNFDTVTPQLSISAPSGEQTNTSLTITSTYIESSNPTCYFWVGLSSNPLNIQYPVTSYDCNSKDFILSTAGSYVMFANITDGIYSNESNSSFSIASSADGGGGGGGGSVTIIEEKKLDCNISVTPSTVYLTNSKTLQEVIIKNNEDFSYTPEFSLLDVEGEESFKEELQITNIPTQILQKQESSFGIKFSGNGDSGENLLVISSSGCKKINVPIILNSGMGEKFLKEFFDPNKNFIENMITIMSSPLIDIEPFNFFPTWGLFILALIGGLIIVYVKTIKNINKKNRVRTVVTILFVFVLALFTTLFLKAGFSFL